ncbi:MAG TPA: DUF4388 domain-containing protein [Myxococcota bacterium]|nr:DUF4388 domain-containing protein [Myxococcota bacterium]
MEAERKLYLPYLFSSLGQASFEGGLTLVEGDVERTVLFRAGVPVSVSSRMQDETLGRILLKEGKISCDEYDKLLGTMVQTRQRAGEVLIALGLLGPQEVFSALEYQTRVKLLNCFKMMDFGFSIREKKVPPEMAISKANLSVVIMEGIQKTFSVDRILTEFPVDEETIFMKIEREQPRSLRMDTRESRIVQAIGSGIPLVKLMSVEEDLQFLLSVLYGLHALEIIEASGVARPGTKDLELDALRDQGRPARKIAPRQPVEPVERTAKESSYNIRPPTLTDAFSSKQVNSVLAEKMLTLDTDDYFSILDIDRDANVQDIDSAYYKLLQDCRLQDIEVSYTNEREQELARQLLDKATIAHRTLSENESRSAYEKFIKASGSKKKIEIPPRLLADVEAQKGKLAIGAKHYQDAMELFDKAIGLYPKEPSYHFKFGTAAYFKALDETPADKPLSDRVRKPFLKAIAINPAYDQARMYLGYISKRNGEYERALKEFSSALHYNPGNRRAHSEVRLLKRRLDLAK